jgi:hypothetical protein
MNGDLERQSGYLDDDERELAETIEKGEWVPVDDISGAIGRAKQYADATLQRLALRAPIASPDGNLDWKAFSESVLRDKPNRCAAYSIKSA